MGVRRQMLAGGRLRKSQYSRVLRPLIAIMGVPRRWLSGAIINGIQEKPEVPSHGVISRCNLDWLPRMPSRSPRDIAQRYGPAGFPLHVWRIVLLNDAPRKPKIAVGSLRTREYELIECQPQMSSDGLRGVKCLGVPRVQIGCFGVTSAINSHQIRGRGDDYNRNHVEGSRGTCP